MSQFLDIEENNSPRPIGSDVSHVSNSGPLHLKAGLSAYNLTGTDYVKHAGPNTTLNGELKLFSRYKSAFLKFPHTSRQYAPEGQVKQLHKKKVESIVKFKLNSGHMRNPSIDSDTHIFNQTVFNPKIKFTPTIQGRFFKASKSQLDLSKAKYRIRQNYNLPCNDSDMLFSSKKRKDSNISPNPFQEADSLYDVDKVSVNYRKLNPLSEKLRMTGELLTFCSSNKIKTKNVLIPKPLVTDLEVSDLGEENEDKYIDNMMDESIDEDPVDFDERKPIVGSKAVSDFYSHYKDLDQIQNQNKLSNIDPSIYTSMLRYSESNKILPNKVGIIRPFGISSSLNVRNYMLGKKYIGMVAEGVKRMNFDEMNLYGNRLNEKGGKKIIKCLRSTHKKIDLGCNKIGRSIKMLEPLLKSPDTMLRVLNLEKNNIGDSVCNELLTSLQTNKKLSSIKLSDNQLSDKISDNLVEFLKNHNYLEELYLRWNNISSLGGKKIFEAIKRNENLKVLDLGWNNLGEGFKMIRYDNGFIEELSGFFEQNNTMLHIDLSNNHFDDKHCEKIVESLKKNHSIYGFHFLGNKGYVNSEGNLILTNPFDSQPSSYHLQKEINSVNPLSKDLNTYEEKLEIRNPCWICDGWIDLEFQWNWVQKHDYSINGSIIDESFMTPNRNSLDASSIMDKDPLHNPVFIHFKHENYKPIYLKPNSDKTLTVRLMVPNTRLFFFFTVNEASRISTDYIHVCLDTPEFVVIIIFYINYNYNLGI